MKELAGFILSSGLSLMATWPLRSLALKAGILDMPGHRKSHAEPIPYLGGVAVFLGAAIAVVILQASGWRILGLLGLMAILGLLDDLGKATVSVKLLVEIALATAAIGMGFTWHLSGWLPADAAVSLLWIVGLTNSFNMLDNMDGLTSTIAATTLLAFAFINPSIGFTPLALAGALIGFLYVNRPPARMFLGDAGSLMTGFGVALGSIMAANSLRGLQSALLLGFPVAAALFDTSLVIVSRRRSHRPVQVGGRDHFSHRLKLLGWSTNQILLAAFLVSAIGGWVGYQAIHHFAIASLAGSLIAASLLLAWLKLLQTNPYGSSNRVNMSHG